MNIRVCVAMSAQSEQKLFSKLLPSSTDGIHVVARLRENKQLRAELASCMDAVDLVLYEPNADDGASLDLWCDSQTEAQLCCLCSGPEQALECLQAGAMFVLFDTSTAIDVDVAIRRCKRVLQSRSRQMIARSPEPAYTPEVIALPHMHGIEVRACDPIVHVEGQGNYTYVVFAREPRLLLSRTIGDYEDVLGGAGFLRVHRSHIVNMKHVRRIVPGKTPRLVLSNGDVVSVSDRYKGILLRKLNVVKRK